MKQAVLSQVEMREYLEHDIKIFGDLHEKNKEAYDEIYETEQKIKDEAEKRKTQGIWRTLRIFIMEAQVTLTARQ
ncbi:MAG: hypothetical protein ACLTLY_02630 [Agathobacter rectalis]